MVNKKVNLLFISFLIFSLGLALPSKGQNSVARIWNEALLEAIRDDFARPTVHARNLFHTSAVMYDAWATYDDLAINYLLGRTLNGYRCNFNGIAAPSNTLNAQKETMSYAAYRLLNHRFKNSPGAEGSLLRFDVVMSDFGYDRAFTSVDYSTGSPAALGNYIAQCMIEYGLQDGSNEVNDYVNVFYEPVNDPLAPVGSGNPDITNPNRWQPLALDVFIGQSGIEIGEFPEFLSPEWGTVLPFSLSDEDLTVYERGGNEYWVYKDPGNPPYHDLDSEGETEALYKWNFSLVSKWSSHLDPTDGVMWDISPASIGNVTSFPTSQVDFDKFYNELDGGDTGMGYDINPTTGEAYAPQIVPRGDYGRVLAEFWADGPESETPPGHWFTLLNYVNDHPMTVKKFNGEGQVLSNLEWDVKSYFMLGGAMHDAAIISWGIKGWYDYIRPISAIRFMADKGQSTYPNDSSYHEDGIPLTEGLIELVREGDELAGTNDRHVGKIKVYAWRGPDYIDEPETDEAGVGWILAENWWPYQRPTFVTPPFAGYVSGHSTYSRAAAEVLTLLTGDPYFPGGMGEFLAEENEFLVFEEGPSMDITLQWATYRDASDQCSLSRIWGGIHPPADDIPGRIMGKEIGIETFNFANNYFNGVITNLENDIDYNSLIAFPNPLKSNQELELRFSEIKEKATFQITDLNGKVLYNNPLLIENNKALIPIGTLNLDKGIYLLKINTSQKSYAKRIVLN